MPCSSRLSMLIDDCHRRDDVHGAIDAYNEWQQSNCYHPIRQRIYDAHIQQYRTVLLPCGTCYHCVETKINEWVTRMYAHCEDFPYVYFVTLTYRPFYSLGDVSRLVFQKLSGALYHYDNCNKEHRFGWNPCLLCKRHYQLFLKHKTRYI